MTRPFRLLAVVLSLGGALAACRRPPGPAAAQTPPPATPVVLISFDTLRADRLNCYGYRRFVLSPHFDALAADGILFENHLAAAPWTIPSHMSLLTSLWPGDHGVTASLAELRNDDVRYPTLSETRTTLAEALAARGYTTAAFTAGETLAPHFGFGQGFARYDTSMLKVDAENMAEMQAWVHAHREGASFLFWHTFELHAPYLGTSLLDSVLDAEEAAAVRDVVGRYADRLRHRQISAARFQPMLEKREVFTPAVLEALYLGALADADHWLGELLDDLKREGLYDRALIVVTSDHGEEFRDHSPARFYNAHGHALWREQVHVPLIVKLPRQEMAATRVSALSRAVDVMPTILDVVHVKGPAEMQGASLRSLWEPTAAVAPRVAFLESLDEAFEMKAVETERYKYVVRIGAESVRKHGRAFLPANPAARSLYDLRSDPAEHQDLLLGAARPEHKRLADELDALLRQHVSAQRPDSRPAKISPELLEGLRALGYVH